MIKDKKKIKEKSMTNIMIAMTAGIVMTSLIFTMSIYPCTYYDAASGEAAGYAYNSLADVLGNDMKWGANALPNRFVTYDGSGPYVVEPATWILILYSTIFLGIGFFCIKLAKKGIWGIIPSRS